MDQGGEDAPPVWIWKLSFGLFALFLGLSVALASMSPAPERPAITAPISSKPTLLVYESASCGWCRYFRNNVAPDYERSHLDALAPLKYMDIGELRRGNAGYRLNGRITATPTFVLVDRAGREVERLRGLPGARDVFMSEIERMLGRIAERASN